MQSAGEVICPLATFGERSWFEEIVVDTSPRGNGVFSMRGNLAGYKLHARKRIPMPNPRCHEALVLENITAFPQRTSLLLYHICLYYTNLVHLFSWTNWQNHVANYKGGYRVYLRFIHCQLQSDLRFALCQLHLALVLHFSQNASLYFHYQTGYHCCYGCCSHARSWATNLSASGRGPSVPPEIESDLREINQKMAYMVGPFLPL